MEENNKEMELKDLENAGGGQKGSFGRSSWGKHSCPDPDNARFVRTGREREDPHFFGLFTQHQYEYRCTVCGATFWNDEERD